MRHKQILPLEQRELVRELMSHEGWKHFIHLIETAILSDMSKNVLDLDMSRGRDELFTEKARYEGARKAIREIEKLKEAMRKADD